MRLGAEPCTRKATDSHPPPPGSQWEILPPRNKGANDNRRCPPVGQEDETAAGRDDSRSLHRQRPRRPARSPDKESPSADNASSGKSVVCAIGPPRQLSCQLSRFSGQRIIQ